MCTIENPQYIIIYTKGSVDENEQNLEQEYEVKRQLSANKQ